MALTDKRCIQQVLGSLIKHPQYLAESDKYSLTPMDFSSNFERYIFSAIHGLFFGGAPKISSVDIETYLSSNDTAKRIFDQNKGMEYLQDIEEFSNEENFFYYYTRLKKLNMLNAYKKLGLDISDFYIEDLTDTRSLEINKRFEDLTIQDISNNIKKKILKIESEYSQTEEVQSWNIADEVDEVIEGFGSTEGIGLPIQGEIYSKVINGAEKGALTIRSAPSGVGKTRMAVADACYLAYPIRYDSESESWVQVGGNEKVLFVITEQKKEQIIKMILSYLTDINESKFKYGRFSVAEEKKLAQAKEIIKLYQNNFIMVRVPNPTIDLIKNVIREQCLNHDIGYVFYDYIFIGPALLNEFRGFTVRNDEVLLMFATALKDLAIELNVCVFTSTQVNAKADDNKDIRNEASLAGGRSTINKADNGAIMARPTKEELEVVEKLSSTVPNVVTDIFKVRSGAWTQVRIWSLFDAGTMRKEDLYMTDSRLEPINDFFDDYSYDIDNWDDDERAKTLEIVENMNKELK